MAKKVEDTIAAISGFPGDGGLGAPGTPTPEPQEPNPREPADIVVDFPMPEGFQVPTGIKQDEEFTALASLKQGSNGDLVLTKIDGIPVNGAAEEEEEAEPGAGEQNKPGATGAAASVPSSGGTAIASARNIMGDMGMPA